MGHVFMNNRGGNETEITYVNVYNGGTFDIPAGTQAKRAILTAHVQQRGTYGTSILRFLGSTNGSTYTEITALLVGTTANASVNYSNTLVFDDIPSIYTRFRVQFDVNYNYATVGTISLLK